MLCLQTVSGTDNVNLYIEFLVYIHEVFKWIWKSKVINFMESCRHPCISSLPVSLELPKKTSMKFKSINLFRISTWNPRSRVWISPELKCLPADIHLFFCLTPKISDTTHSGQQVVPASHKFLFDWAIKDPAPVSYSLEDTVTAVGNKSSKIKETLWLRRSYTTQLVRNTTYTDAISKRSHSWRCEPLRTVWNHSEGVYWVKLQLLD